MRQDPRCKLFIWEVTPGAVRAVGKGTERGEATGACSWYSDHLPALPRPESFLGRGTLDDKTETLLDKPGAANLPGS